MTTLESILVLTCILLVFVSTFQTLVAYNCSKTCNRVEKLLDKKKKKGK